jgi:hypothetical protein
MPDKVSKWLPTAIALLALAIAAASAANAAPGKIVVRKGDIAPGAVTNKALGKGVVSANKIRKGTITAAKLAKGAVTPEAIAAGAVTGPAIAAGSIQAPMLAREAVVTKPIADKDQVEHNGVWTPSNEELAACAPGEYLIGGGLAFGGPSNGETSLLKLLPVVNGTTNGMFGQFSSDAGGTASAQVYAICLP